MTLQEAIFIDTSTYRVFSSYFVRKFSREFEAYQ